MPFLFWVSCVLSITGTFAFLIVSDERFLWGEQKKRYVALATLSFITAYAGTSSSVAILLLHWTFLPLFGATLLAPLIAFFPWVCMAMISLALLHRFGVMSA